VATSLKYPSVVGSERLAFWQAYGFLVFPGFFDDSEIAAVQRVDDRIWEERRRRRDVVIDDLVEGRRLLIADLDDSARDHHFKVNDLYLSETELRDVVLSDRLGAVLEELLGDEPSICNTLNFDQGSEQPDHLDTLYMTPESDRGLVATWMALEDATPDAGPLRYYPESHQIEPYRFSTGSLHNVGAEMPQWADYMAGEVDRRGLDEMRFSARKGDLFIWHALLLHGGCAIANRSLTRKSLVTHYWRQADCEKRRLDLRPAAGGWWINRPPLPVPDYRSPESVAVDASNDTVVDFPVDVSGVVMSSDLRERFDGLAGGTD
jgi:phytanoyl-CoA hydroxylase